MTLSETAKIIAIIKTYYPFMNQSGVSEEDVTNAWNVVLGQYEFKEISQAVADFVSCDVKGFPPSPGQLIDLVWKKKNPTKEYDELKIADTIRRAASRSSMSRSSIYIGDTRTSAEREFDKLPDELKLIVGTPSQLADWGTLNDEAFESVVESHIIKTYRTKRESDKQGEKYTLETRVEIDRKIHGETPKQLPKAVESAQESEDVGIEDAGLDDDTYHFLKDLIVRTGKLKEEKPRESIKTQTEVMREMSEDDLAKLAEVRRKWEEKRNAEDRKTV